jgi:hypothetical protein
VQPALARRGLIERRRPDAGQGAGAGLDEIPESLRTLKADLNAKGIALACMIIYRPGDSEGALSKLLKSGGFRVIEVQSRPNWVMSGDGHWNSVGHHEAAALVSEDIQAGGVLPATHRRHRKTP